ncbi:putative C6 transcription factor [Rhizodiscina lignyota]|uniref:C6 transcription factor n=1 Tax=Rhizodiscina lignyota TaxID=1504668 RepID=A0A9P4I8K6_9PEZI|nr:putative C6 transcription factor [Rhizodiscina lignyota]
MSTVPTPAPTPDSSSKLSKPQRVLACVLCQQRKVRCDRKFPCANCIKSGAQCVPATLNPRRRRRRFPERELLERLHKYEELLRQNNIKFEPLHKDQVGEKESPNAQSGNDSDDEQQEVEGPGSSSHSTIVKPRRAHKSKYALSKKLESSEDDVREVVVRKLYDQLFEDNDHLLFGSRKTNVDLSTLHPEPVQIFRLWQMYLDNVDPLLKVTHTPSLQGRIIEAASDITKVSPNLEALMFSIYCMSLQSLTPQDSQSMFGSSSGDLLPRYQFGCQQALLNCGFLRSSDRDCLTALYLYLVSVRSGTDPRALSSMLGIALRIAQRMGIHSESACAKCSVLEAEMRRRLWWSLTLFDTRIGELAICKTAMLAPLWDCKIPLNVNDSDLRPEMKEPPAVQERSTEALFVAVRSELGEFVRHTRFHLDFANPALKAFAKGVQHAHDLEGGELVALEKMIEDKYLQFCDPDSPLHFMTIWMTRGYLAKCRLVEHYSRYSKSSAHQTEAQLEDAISYALSMLECDTKIMTSPLTKGYLWLAHFYFPFPAYIHIIQDLKRRPLSEQAEQCWRLMSDNYEARFVFDLDISDGPFHNIMSSLVLRAWEAHEAASTQSGEPLNPPKMVSRIREKVTKAAQNTADTDQLNSVMGMGSADFPMSMPTDFGNQSLLFGMGGVGGYAGTAPGVYPHIPGQAPFDFDLNQLNWAAMGWSLPI